MRSANRHNLKQFFTRTKIFEKPFSLIVLKNEIISPPQLHKFEYRFKIKTKIP